MGYGVFYGVLIVLFDVKSQFIANQNCQALNRRLNNY